MIVKFAMLWRQGGFSDSVRMWAIFIPASHLGGNHTRRYWDLAGKLLIFRVLPDFDRPKTLS